MKLIIESTEIKDKDFPKKGTNDGSRWYIREQPILLFKDDSRYPDKGFIALSFTDDKLIRDSSSTLAKGEYEIKDDGFYFDKNGNMQLNFKPENLKPKTIQKAA